MKKKASRPATKKTQTKSKTRKGAVRRADIPPDGLRQLNAGTLESATLAEGLAVDFGKLLKAVAPELPADSRKRIRPKDGITTRMRTAGEILAGHYGLEGMTTFATHSSDTVRGWSAFMLTACPELTLAQRLKHIEPLADDPHFGVREWAWLALRDALAKDILGAIELLQPWTGEDSANLRRFAVESTRPRGVWCAHIALLKDEPEHGTPLLEPLRSDTSKYVRDSVANWLNDAGKSQPDWVRKLCERWNQESSTPETAYITRRASRSL